MSDETIEIAVEVPAGTKVALESAAAAQAISVSAFIKTAVQKMLAEEQAVRRRSISE